MSEDLRPDDVDFIMENGLPNGAFGRVWEKELHKVKHTGSQERWHLARMAMLAGYLLGNGESLEDVVSTLEDGRDKLNKINSSNSEKGDV
jgi:hypothetical protein